jgi:diguanylate cyclase (GGDEF)-like protein
MQRSLVDIALLLLLILFFGVQQRHHRALHFRLWLYAWIFGLASFASLRLPLFPGEPLGLYYSITWDFALLGSITFAMSFLGANGGLRRALLLILAVEAMLGGAVDLILLTDAPSLTGRLLCVLLLVLGHALLILLVWREFSPRQRWQRALAVLLGVALWAADAYGFFWHPRKDLGDWLSAEIYLCAAIAYGIYANRPGRRLIGALGVVGFIAWGAYCMTHFVLGEASSIVQALYLVWTIPKYFVAFSMILMAFEETNREKDELMATTQRLSLELAHRAHHDVLTGLPNRALLEDRLEKALEYCLRDGRKAALMTIDIDHFKRINDDYGHLAGDACLQVVAALLQSKIRQVDTLARIGGEEFVAMICALRDTEDARIVANGLLKLFEEPLEFADLSVKMTVSIGVAVFPDDGHDADTLRQRSDEALYVAKGNGRNRVEYAARTKRATGAVDADAPVQLGAE